MRIRIVKDSTSGAIPIPANEYWVSFMPEAGEFVLSAGGKDIKLKATRRRKDAKTKTTSIQFYKAGGNTWSLIVFTPKHGEWITLLDQITY